MTMDYRSKAKARHLPEKLVTVDQLRGFFDAFDREIFMVTLVSVEGGYQFRVHPTYNPKNAHVVKAEKSGQLRIFKSVQAALNLAKSFGFSEVAVEL